MTDMAHTTRTFSFVGESLCLDFTNTVGSHASETQADYFGDYADLVAWARRAGILADAEEQRLIREAAARPADAQATLEQAVNLRETIYRIFSAIAGNRFPDDADLEALNQNVAGALSHLQITRTTGEFAWTWNHQPGQLDWLLWPVLRSAAELLTSDQLDKVRTCGNPCCGWLFLDTSRNHSRRWCDMRDCGNRAKAHRHYERKVAHRSA